jgi:hypothetical protein
MDKFARKQEREKNYLCRSIFLTLYSSVHRHTQRFNLLFIAVFYTSLALFSAPKNKFVFMKWEVDKKKRERKKERKMKILFFLSFFQMMMGIKQMERERESESKSRKEGNTRKT